MTTGFTVLALIVAFNILSGNEEKIDNTEHNYDHLLDSDEDDSRGWFW